MGLRNFGGSDGAEMERNDEQEKLKESGSGGIGKHTACAGGPAMACVWLQLPMVFNSATTTHP